MGWRLAFGAWPHRASEGAVRWSPLEVPAVHAGAYRRLAADTGGRCPARTTRRSRVRYRSAMEPLDRLGRPLRDLRISVTDRCNFRCTYCMPKEVFGRDYAFLPRDQVLTFEEIERAARAFVALGVEKLRITGGEPLVRRDLPELIGDARGAAHDRRASRST